MNSPDDFEIPHIVAPTIENCRKHPRKARIDRLVAERERKLQAIRDKYTCRHSSKHVAVVVARNLTRMYCYQCDDCGEQVGNWIAQAQLDTRVMQLAPERDRTLSDLLWAEKDKATRKVLAEYESLWKLKRSLYQVYVVEGSPEWHCRRLAVLARDGHICTICEKNQATQVHHITYDNLGNEPLEDLQSVCEECHNNLHDEMDALKDQEFFEYEP